MGESGNATSSTSCCSISTDVIPTLYTDELLSASFQPEIALCKVLRRNLLDKFAGLTFSLEIPGFLRLAISSSSEQHSSSSAIGANTGSAISFTSSTTSDECMPSGTPI